VTAPRQTRSGAWVPWALDYFAGVDEQDRLRGEGLTLDLDSAELAALGRAMAEQREAQAPPLAQAHDLTLSLEARQALDRIVAERAAMPEHWSWPAQQGLHRGHHHAANESCGQSVVTDPVPPGQGAGHGIEHHTPWPRPAPRLAQPLRPRSRTMGTIAPRTMGGVTRLGMSRTKTQGTNDANSTGPS
jgi:hypothetical protein